MRVYLVWKTGERSVEILEATQIVEDTLSKAPQLPRVVIITSLMDTLNADEILTCDTEEQMLDMFKGSTVIYKKRKEELH